MTEHARPRLRIALVKPLLVVAALLLAGCTTQVAHPSPLTEQELAQYVQTEQDSRWFYSDRSTQTRPRVDAVLIHLDEVGGPYNDCILDDEVSDTTCHLTYIYYPHEVGYFSASELGYLYDYFTDELVPCLEAQGLQIAQVPTRQQFAGSAGFVSWDPYAEVNGPVPALVMQQCPAEPR